MRHRLLIATLTAFFLGALPNAVASNATGALHDLAAPPSAIAAQAPTGSSATHAPVWTKHAKRVRAGRVLRATLDPVSARKCTITVLGASRRLSTRRSIVGDGRLAVLSLHTSRSAKRGSWALTANCKQVDGTTLAANVSFKVTNSRRGARGRLVTAKQIRVTRRAIFADQRGAGAQGKGAGKNLFDMRQCTSWAYEKRQDVYDAAVRAGVHRDGLVARPAFSEDYVWNGKRWAENARAGGIPTGTAPAVGALFVDTNGRYGHVALVEEVYGDGRFKISQRNQSGRGNSEQVTTSIQLPGRPGIEFVYGGPAAGAEFIGHIVHWDGDTKSQKTAWYVVNNGGHPQRNWIPNSATFYCLKRRGAPGPDVLPSAVLSNQLPDQNGVSASCTDGQGATDPEPNTAFPPPGTIAPPPQPPQPSTWPETTGGAANTWTNHTNAGGTQGPTIAAGATVQIACKLPGFRVADGNTWWYRIAQDPWSNAYYVSADAFYNNGQTSGSLRGTPFVDPAVADC